MAERGNTMTDCSVKLVSTQLLYSEAPANLPCDMDSYYS